MPKYPVRTLILIVAALCAGRAYSAPVDYDRDIKPLLAAHCVSCHGPTKPKADLRLDLHARILVGGNTGSAVTPKKSAESLLIHAVTGSKPDVSKMPPKGALSAEQIALLKRWIDEGAAGPAKPETVSQGAVASAHWSFQPVKRPPILAGTAVGLHPVDYFINDRLRKDSIKPSAVADRVTLIRRVTLDLTGLPPTLKEVDDFLADQAPGAYERVVDRLLKSPHYGEMQGRLWLDLARYADSNGYTIDGPRSIWKYRDWVINAFQNDMPFDRFTIEQLAGDLLPGAKQEQVIATGFHRNTMRNEEGGIDQEQFRVEAVVDRVNTTGTVWLGLTVGCCQCHDHKFDPLTQREYYQLMAFFNNCDEPNIEIIGPEAQKARQAIQQRLKLVEKQWKELDPTSAEKIEKWERGLTDETRHLVPKAVAAIFGVAPNGRSAKQKQALEAAYRSNDQLRHVLGITHPLTAAINVAAMQKRKELESLYVDLKKKEPTAVTTMVLRERKIPRETNVMIQGDFTRKGVKVSPGYFGVLPAGAQAANRLDLARWLVDAKNPLTARVTVNRFWVHLFGNGLVETENDFGTQGTPPSHPELLDWLADEFMRSGWSVKHMIRTIVTSTAYQRSSHARPDLDKADPRNRLLARQSRLRLNAELIRDAALSAGGLLNTQVGGPSVFPPQPEGVYRFTQVDKAWKPSPGEERYRRGLYTYFWRSAPHPQLVVFDAPDGTTTCTRRNRSNTPLQALTLLNDTGFQEYARGLARRVQELPTTDDRDRLRTAFRWCLAREPNARELDRLFAYYTLQAADLKADPAESARIMPEAPASAPWLLTARVLLNLDEFITRE